MDDSIVVVVFVIAKREGERERGIERAYIHIYTTSDYAHNQSTSG